MTAAVGEKTPQSPGWADSMHDSSPSHSAVIQEFSDHLTGEDSVS